MATLNEERAERGRKALLQHPDYTATDVTATASDTIADVIHAAAAAGVFDGRCETPQELLDRALRTYQGDAEDAS